MDNFLKLEKGKNYKFELSKQRYHLYTHFLEKKPNEWVCADCGTESQTRGPCLSCKGFRLALISVVEKEFGKDWKKYFEESKN